MTSEEIAWAAGFLEGEGYFEPEMIIASQVGREPLERLQQMFGGRLREDIRQPPRQNLWRWIARGEEAKVCIRAIWPWMSRRKQLQCTYSPGSNVRPGRGVDPESDAPVWPPQETLV